MCKKLVIVDCENCFNKEIAKIFNKHIEFDYKLIIGKDQKLDTSRLFIPVEYIRCSTTGHNATDFFLICVLVNILTNKKYSYTEAYLVSNDKGFDGAIKYLRGIGFKVQRLGSRYVENDFSFVGLTELEIRSCTSSYSDKERSKILREHKERVKKDKIAYKLKIIQENKKLPRYSEDDRKISTLNELNKLFEQLVKRTNTYNKNNRNPVNNKNKRMKQIKYKPAIEGAKAIKHFGTCGTKAITVYRQIENWGSITDPKKVMSVLVDHGIIKLVKNTRNKAIQVYWSKKDLNNYIIN